MSDANDDAGGRCGLRIARWGIFRLCCVPMVMRAFIVLLGNATYIASWMGKPYRVKKKVTFKTSY